MICEYLSVSKTMERPYEHVREWKPEKNFNKYNFLKFLSSSILVFYSFSSKGDKWWSSTYKSLKPNDNKNFYIKNEKWKKYISISFNWI